MKSPNYRAITTRSMRDLQEVFDSFKMEIHLNNHKKWFVPILEQFIKHNYLVISERRCLNYLPGHEPAPAAAQPVISSPADISMPTPALPMPASTAAPAPKVGGEGVAAHATAAATDQSSPISKNPQSLPSSSPVAEVKAVDGANSDSKAVCSVVVGDGYPGTLSRNEGVLIAPEWPKEGKVKVIGVCNNLRLMVGELEDGRRVSFWRGPRNWRINDWVAMRLDRGGGAPVYLPV